MGTVVKLCSVDSIVNNFHFKYFLTNNFLLQQNILLNNKCFIYFNTCFMMIVLGLMSVRVVIWSSKMEVINANVVFIEPLWTQTPKQFSSHLFMYFSSSINAIQLGGNAKNLILQICFMKCKCGLRSWKQFWLHTFSWHAFLC